MKVCDLCGSAARMYCESDRASLCWGCDAKVHGANFLVARHLRTLLCYACQTPTPWKASGAKLGPAVSVCVDGDGCGRRESREGDEWSRRSGSHGGENEHSEEDDSEEGENWGGDDSEEDDEADNQVVPRRCSPPPPSPSSSSSEDSPSRLSDSGGDEPHQRRFSVKRPSLAFQDDGCSSSASPRQQRSSASLDATSSSADLFRRPSKRQIRSDPVWTAAGSSSTAANGRVDPSLAGGRGTSKADA